MTTKKPKKSRVDKVQASKKRKQPDGVVRKGLPESLPTSVQKSYFMLSDSERNVLNIGLQKYRPGQSAPILIGGENLLKPALRLMSDYRLRIDEIKGAEVVTSYTRWLEAVIAAGNGKSGSLRNIQSTIRAHLAGIQEATPPVHCQRTGQSRTTKPIFDSLVQLGQKVRISRYEAHLVGGLAKSARVAVSKRCGRKDHPRSSVADLG